MISFSELRKRCRASDKSRARPFRTRLRRYFGSKEVLQQQEKGNTGDSECAGDNGIEPVQIQRDADNAAEEIKEKEKDKTEQRVDQQLKRQPDRFSENSEQQYKQQDCRRCGNCQKCDAE